MRSITTVVLTLGLIAGCASDDIVSAEQIAIQNRADRAVAGLLFESGLDEGVSYHVRRDGFVVMLFGRSVPEPVYTDIVARLRGHRDVAGVRATLDGREVCPLRR